MLTWYRRWRAQRLADREAVRQTERIIRAFIEGDQEVIQAEVARHYSRYFIVLARQLEYVRNNLITDERADRP